ncbi:MAG: hypothetical protein R2729_02335 [Bryobacteraceae bacterium]
MNVRHLVSSVSRRLLSAGSLVLVAGLQQLVHASGVDLSQFRRIEPQYIAALGDSRSTHGKGAQSWGLWSEDPGPRGYQLDRYGQLEAAGGVTPSGWKFDAADWWLEEHGLIMEKPAFPLPPGKYLVTGGREVTTVLTIHPKDKNGAQRWELADGATLYDVTHLACRAASYRPAKANKACSPANVRTTGFPVSPDAAMPAVKGCRKQDYAVLIVVGLSAAR